MAKLFCSDLYHMYSKKLLWICVVSMMGLSVAFCVMQYTALDYKVALDRVIFLPMTFYGVIMAAMTSIFMGGNFSDGIIRNKIIAGHSRTAVYISLAAVLYIASVTVYLFSVITSLSIGVNLFEINVSFADIARYTALGMLTCIAHISIFCFVSAVIGNRSACMAVCMILSFIMLYIALQTNAVLAAPEFKDGAVNIHYVRGMKRSIYEWLYNINPTGQTAQLSMMKIEHTGRFIIVDVVSALVCGTAGTLIFRQKDLK